MQPTTLTTPAGSGLRFDLQTVLLFCVFAAGLGLRLWNLDDRALWLDEAYSKWYSGLDLGYLWWLVPRAETHPPLYYTILKGWRIIAGDSVFALRLLSVVAGCATLFVTWRSALELGRILGKSPSIMRWLAIVATAYVAVSPILIAGTRQARPYGLLVFFFGLSLWALLRLYRDLRNDIAPSALVWLTYFVSLEMVLWLHALGPLFAFCLSLALFLSCLAAKQGKAQWAWLFSGHAAVLLLYTPCLIMIFQAARWWTHSTWAPFSIETAGRSISLLFGIDPITGTLAIVLLGLAGWCALRDRQDPRVILLMALLALGPVLLAILLSATVAPVLVQRTLSSAVLPAALMIGTVAVRREGQSPLFALAGALVLMLSYGSAITLRQMIPEDWKAIANWIKQHRGPADEIWVYPNDASLPLRYAMADIDHQRPIRQLPMPFPAISFHGEHPSGSPAVVTASPSQLRAIVNAPSAGRVPTIWLLRGVKTFYDPADVLDQALLQQRHIVASADFGPINVTGFGQAPHATTPRE